MTEDDTTITIEDGDVTLSVSGEDPDAAALEAALDAYREAADDPGAFEMPDTTDFGPPDLPDPAPRPVLPYSRPGPPPWDDDIYVTSGDHTLPEQTVRDLALNARYSTD